MQHGRYFKTWHRCTRWQIYLMRSEKSACSSSYRCIVNWNVYILLTVFIYIFIIDFQRSKGGSSFSEKKSSDMFRPEYIQWQNVARVEIKLLLQGVDKMYLVRVPHLDFCPHKSLMQQGVIFIIWHSDTRWQIYQMRSADISMFIIIQMYRKRKVTYYEQCWSFF